jgi:hypothetical protein
MLPEEGFKILYNIPAGEIKKKWQTSRVGPAQVSESKHKPFCKPYFSRP